MPNRDDDLAVVRNRGMLAFTAPREHSSQPSQDLESASITLLARARNDIGEAERRIASCLSRIEIEGPWWLWSTGYVPENRLQERRLRDDLASPALHADAGTALDVGGRITWVRRLKAGAWQGLFTAFDAPWPHWAIVRAPGCGPEEIATALARSDPSEFAQAAVDRGWWLAGTETDLCTWSGLTFFAPADDLNELERRLVTFGAVCLTDDDVATFLTA